MNFDTFIDFLKKDFPELTDIQVNQFRQMDGLYRDWNSKINVISRKDIDQLYDHHILHSLAIAAFLKFQMPEAYEAMRNGSGMKILDLGTGGGFPGIPLAVMFPNVLFTLCDSIGKKTLVASEVAKALNLGNVNVVNARAETLGETYNYVVSRAVTSLDKFLPWVKGKYSEGILYLKGGDLAEEIAVAMQKFKMPKGSVHPWEISSWLDDDFFNGKLVLFIE